MIASIAEFFKQFIEPETGQADADKALQIATAVLLLEMMRMDNRFSDEERGLMTRLLDSGFVDTFRHRYPAATGAYSWWSYRYGARERNAGWRIDYFIVSERFVPRVRDSILLNQVLGSDHCPVSITVK